LWVLPGVVMLLSLALPWVATLQFVAGYPLRVVVAMGAEKVLRLMGVLVTREGTDLWYEGVAVGVDAPCSGIRMLWFLLFAAAFLAARFGLRWGADRLVDAGGGRAGFGSERSAGDGAVFSGGGTGGVAALDA
jgi:hypothetical protein